MPISEELERFPGIPRLLAMNVSSVYVSRWAPRTANLHSRGSHRLFDDCDNREKRSSNFGLDWCTLLAVNSEVNIYEPDLNLDLRVRPSGLSQRLRCKSGNFADNRAASAHNCIRVLSSAPGPTESAESTNRFSAP